MNISTSKQSASAIVVGFALAVASCATQKAALPESPAKVEAAEEKPADVVAESPAQNLPFEGDGMRMPDMFGLPGEGEFRATNPKLPQATGESGAVISRPPTDPPSRVKTPLEDAE